MSSDRAGPITGGRGERALPRRIGRPAQSNSGLKVWKVAKDSRLLSRPWTFGTAVVGFAMLAAYLALIVAQGGVALIDVLPWAVLMLIAALAALAAAQFEDRRIARKIMVAAAGLFTLLGVVSIFTIGIRFLVAAVLAVLASIPL